MRTHQSKMAAWDSLSCSSMGVLTNEQPCKPLLTVEMLRLSVVTISFQDQDSCFQFHKLSQCFWNGDSKVGIAVIACN